MKDTTKYTIDYCRNNRVAIQIKNKEQHTKLFELFKVDQWVYCNNMCYRFCRYQNNDTGYSTKQSYEENGFTIIQFEELCIEPEQCYYLLNDPMNQTAVCKITGYYLNFTKNTTAVAITADGPTACYTALKNANLLNYWFTKHEIISLPKVGDWITILGSGGHISAMATKRIEIGDVVKINRIDISGDDTDAALSNGGYIRLSTKGQINYEKYYRLATKDEISKVSLVRFEMAPGFVIEVNTQTKQAIISSGENITHYVKAVQQWWDINKSLGIGNGNNYSFLLNENSIMLDKTGCINKQTKLSQWLEIANLIK